jgi:hypothetical protein
MRVTSKLLALTLAAALQPAVAGVVALNFEDVTGFGKLGDQYASSGVTFTGNAWGVSSILNDCGGVLLFSRPGSCGALLLGDPQQFATPDPRDFTIDLADGFVNEFAFVYGVRGGSDVVIKLFDGIGGTGNALQTLEGLTGGSCGQSGISFCQWHNGSIKFEGTARSMTISGVDQRLMLDDLRFTTPTVGTPLPEPASIALALGALGAAGWTRRRAAR